VDAKERRIFEWLIEQIASIDHALYLRGQEHRALVDVLSRKGVVTREEWKDMVKERRVRRKEPVDDVADADQHARAVQKLKRAVLGDDRTPD
jgi:hypothetical protein